LFTWARNLTLIA